MNRLVTIAIVLGRTDFGEADRILTVLTPDYGRLRLMAKGVRKIKSKLVGGIELFSISHITFIKGKGDIGTLVSTRLQKHYSHIISDVNRTMQGYEALKLINKNVEDNAGREYFDLLEAALEGLDNLDLHQEAVELWLYAQLLKHNGHMLNLKTDVSGKKLESDKKYLFDTENMTFFVSPRGSYSANHIKLLRLTFELNTPTKLLNIQSLQDTLPPTLVLIRTAFNSHRS